MSRDENELLTIKYEAKPLGLLSDADLLKATGVIILKIYIITGWQVPQKELKNILIDQLSKKIKESYPNVNEMEVEYAFRHNLTVKDWGKSMNLVLIDEVLGDYLEKRSCISMAEERYRLKLLAPPPDPKEEELSDEDFIEANRSVFTLTKSYGLIAPACYDILVKQGKINLSLEEKDEIKKKVSTNFFAAENKENIKNMNHQEQERNIRMDCKKWATAEYFNHS